MALGAERRNVLGLVVRQGMVLVGVGLAIGIAGALLLTRLISTLLFGTSSTDPATFALVAVLLAGVALGASLIPALRATRVDPISALRYE
jgi:ABC-type antimicrobial peptide transport system permease subunit